MKVLLLFCLATGVVALMPGASTKTPLSHKFVGSESDKVGLAGKVVSGHPTTATNATNDKVLKKKTLAPGTPAVSVGRSLKYFHLDSMYVDGKAVKSVKTKVPDVKTSGHVRVKKDQFNAESAVNHAPRITSKTGFSSPFEDGGSEKAQYQHLGFTSAYYDYHPHHHHYEEPEPIIEIIIKESNQSLPAPPAPSPPPKKKKKEPVQVYYVKYKKEPSSHYGGEKIVYEPPVPAITPPTNHHDDEEEEEAEEYHHHEEPVTLPPRPSTTLKAIIRPDSETYHGSGIHITFGGPKDEESDHHHHDHHHDHHSPGGYEEQSAPQPSVLLAPKSKSPVPVQPTPNSQLTKRNPTPYHSQTLPPQQSFHSGSPVSTSADIYRPTPGPVYQNTARFSPQPYPFTQQPSKTPLGPSPSSPTPSRSPPSLRYTTLPHFPTFSKPQTSFSFPQSPQPSSPPLGTQTLFSINQPHLKSSFSLGSRSNPPVYQTISNRVTQQPFSKLQTISSSPPFQPLPNFSQPARSFPPRPNHPFIQQPNSYPQLGSAFNQPTFSHPQKVNPSDSRSQISAVLPTPAHPHPLKHQQPQIQRQPHNQFQLDSFKHHQLIEQFNQQKRQQKLDLQRQQQIEQLKQQQHRQQLENVNHLQRQQQQLQRQQFEQFRRQEEQQRSQLQEGQNFQKQSFTTQRVSAQTTYAPEIIKSISAEFPFDSSHRFDPNPQSFLLTTRPEHYSVQNNLQSTPRESLIQNVEQTGWPQFNRNTQPPARPPQSREHFVQNVPSTSKPNFVHNTQANTQSFAHSKSSTRTTVQYAETTQPPVEYITQDPIKAAEEKKKKEERRKQNVAALPEEVPEDLRKQLLSSDILSNADIQILDYDKIGDIPIDKLPPEALANFQAIAGSETVSRVVKPDFSSEIVAEGSEQHSVAVAPPSEGMEMKVVRYDPNSQEGAQVAQRYMKEDATQLEPVVLNDSRYNRYLPLKVSGAQFPVPDVPELRGKNVTSVVVLAPVDYEFLQRHDEPAYDGRTGRSSHPVLEVQGVHFITGDILKTLVKKPTRENYKLWLEKENSTSVDKQSVILLVADLKENTTNDPQSREIFMYDIGTQKVNKLSGELSAQFVEVAESNSENDDLEEISDNQQGSFTVKDASEVSSAQQERKQRSAEESYGTIQKPDPEPALPSKR